MDAWNKCALSAGKTLVHKIPRLGGGILGFGGGGSADFIFMGARIFLIGGRVGPRLRDKPKGTSANLRFSAGSRSFLWFPAKIHDS